MVKVMLLVMQETMKFFIRSGYGDSKPPLAVPRTINMVVWARAVALPHLPSLLLAL